ncbi:hypothetical protein [Nostoc sp. CCY 9925]
MPEDWFCPACGTKKVKKLCDSPR